MAETDDRAGPELPPHDRHKIGDATFRFATTDPGRRPTLVILYGPLKDANAAVLRSLGVSAAAAGRRAFVADLAGDEILHLSRLACVLALTDPLKPAPEPPR
jgi:hypothetical protein